MSLQTDCEGMVPEFVLPLLPRKYDIIGDIALLSLPDSLSAFYGEIANAIRYRRKNIKTVVRKLSKAEGDERVTPL